MRAHAREVRDLTDAKVYSDQLQLGREVAEVLKRNIVQGEKVENGTDTWRTYPISLDVPRMLMARGGL